MTTQPTPQQLIDAYLAECRRTAGDAYTDDLRLWYNPRGGWYHLGTPYKTGPNSWTPSGARYCYRRKQIEQRTAVLKTRKDYAQTDLDKPQQIGYNDSNADNPHRCNKKRTGL